MVSLAVELQSCGCRTFGPLICLSQVNHILLLLVHGRVLGCSEQSPSPHLRPCWSNEITLGIMKAAVPD